MTTLNDYLPDDSDDGELTPDETPERRDTGHQLPPVDEDQSPPETDPENGTDD
jgi:hypothetical protein